METQNPYEDILSALNEELNLSEKDKEERKAKRQEHPAEFIPCMVSAEKAQDINRKLADEEKNQKELAELIQRKESGEKLSFEELLRIGAIHILPADDR